MSTLSINQTTMEMEARTGDNNDNSVQNSVDDDIPVGSADVLNQGLEVELFAESEIELLSDSSDQQSPGSNSPNVSITDQEFELDLVPIKYVAAEMDVDIPKQKTSFSQDQTINWDACNTKFVYSDYDTLENELGEIYSYYEMSSLSYNFEMFHTYLGAKKIKNWFTSSASTKCNFLNDLLDDLELVDKYKKSDAVLALNYLIQGCWKDLETATEQLECIEENVLLLLQCNGFSRVWNLVICVLLKIEEGELKAWTWGVDERIMENCLNVLCTITSVALRNRDETLVKEFLLEIREDSVLITALESFVKIIGNISNQSFLLKKLLLLIKNFILFTIGDSNDLRRLREQCRKAAGLKPCKEDTVTNCRNIEILQKNLSWNNSQEDNLMMTEEGLRDYARRIDENKALHDVDKNQKNYLPWSPKSSLDVFGANLKANKVYKVETQLQVTMWMKQKAHRLVQHLHVPLSAFHLQEEELIRKYPKSLANQEKPGLENMEHVFLTLLPILENVTNALITVLTNAVAPSNPALINVKNMKPNLPFVPLLGETIEEDSLRQSEIIVKAVSAILILLLKHSKLNHVLQFECIASEIVAACAIPTILRFFNRNVENHLSQLPVMPHPDCPFKAINVELCIYQEGIENISNLIKNGYFGLSWRNTYSHINLLRILNKLVKGKPSRILMLSMFKAQHCLKRCLNVKDSLFQQYTLKLLKLQCKYLGQDWKRNNQYIISAIYHKVRHRLLEDWIGEISSSSKLKKRLENNPRISKWPWNYSKEEHHLHQKILSFLKRRYSDDDDKADIDKDDTLPICCEIGNKCTEVMLPESFKENYEQWLERNVLNKTIQWEKLLCDPYLI